LALGGAVLAAAVCASSAAGGTTTQPEGLTVSTPRLTAGERRAITVKSISATADRSLGLIVTVTFQGNVERYLGQGDLANGLVALVLVPNAPGTATSSLADEGGGFTPTRIPIVERTGKHVTVSARTVDLFGAEQVLHRQTPPGAGVVRNGSQITFYVGPAARDRLAGIKLKVFARSPASGGRRAGARSWPAILNARASEVATLSVDQSELSYTQLAGPRDALTNLLSEGVDQELGTQRQTATALKTAVAAYATVAKALRRTRRLPHLSKDALAADRGRASLRTARLTNEAVAVSGLIAQLNALITTRTPPPPPPPPPPPAPQPNVQVVQTDPALSQNMAAQAGLTTSTTPPQGAAEMIEVNDQVRYQQFRGLGAAMTDSSASVINGMPSADRAALIQDLFGPPSAGSGLTAPPIHLDFLRVGIGATGAMTVGPAYSYDDNPPGGTDANLDHFDISHDTSYIIPTLQQVLQTNPNLEILANPWSPPAWMKSNDSLGNSSAGGDLLTQYYQTYANYFVKFIQAYAQAGIPIGAITPANEPTSGTGGTGYPGLNFPESDEAQFIANDLKPALNNAGLHPAIYGNDLSWDKYTDYASPLASDANAGPDLAGVSWHCYFGSPTVMSQLEQTNPGLDQIIDECSPEIRGFGTPEFLISTLRNWASVVAAWSVALEPNGQPIQTPNSCGGCRGLVSVDPSTGAVTYRTEYYQFGQVSAFVQPGARRIDSPNFVTYGTNGSNIETISSGLDDVAFVNPDGSKVLVAYNNSTAPSSFGVQSDGSYFSYTIPAGAMTTFVWR
jgi:glucosylceramidase